MAAKALKYKGAWREVLTMKREHEITSVACSADWSVAGDEGLAKIYDTAKGEEIATLKGHGGIVFAIVFSSDGNHVVTGGDDTVARIWDATTGKALAKLEGTRIPSDARPSIRAARSWSPARRTRT